MISLSDHPNWLTFDFENLLKQLEIEPTNRAISWIMNNYFYLKQMVDVKDPEMIVYVAYGIGQRLKIYETIIIETKCLDLILDYVKDVVKGRWEEAEHIIRRDNRYYQAYLKYIR